MLKELSSILCDLDPKVKVIGQKAGICDGVPSTSALVNKLICCSVGSNMVTLYIFCKFICCYLRSNILILYSIYFFHVLNKFVSCSVRRDKCTFLHGNSLREAV